MCFSAFIFFKLSVLCLFGKCNLLLLCFVTDCFLFMLLILYFKKLCLKKKKIEVGSVPWDRPPPPSQMNVWSDCQAENSIQACGYQKGTKMGLFSCYFSICIFKNTMSKIALWSYFYFILFFKISMALGQYCLFPYELVGKGRKKKSELLKTSRKSPPGKRHFELPILNHCWG